MAVVPTVPGLILRFFGGLRFPILFVITLVLFSMDLIVPDAIPFADELLLGLAALLFGKLKRRGHPGVSGGSG